ncbi:lipoate--protein ligase family protein [Natrialba sp. INN-245]|uniref:lipoyl protein ligase domain-containing protein n=1 Tax=Natrialba sp. INN-245 TaxID=2690967 RepID=UPI001F275B77|nr:lipoate--protein ligase family protein [Natrialba sp. INN-245]
MRLYRGRPSTIETDRAASTRLLEVAAAGDPAARVWVPHRQVAFGRRDAGTDGYSRALEAARARGFPAVERAVGGRAVAYDGETTIAFARAEPVADFRRGIDDRYERTTAAIERALGDVGLEPRRGEPDGAFCPGSHSLSIAAPSGAGDGNSRSAKVVGIAQRVRQQAAVTAGIVVVDGGNELVGVLEDVYGALGLTFDPDAVGALADAGVDVGPETVRAALETALAGDDEPEPRPIADLVDGKPGNASRPSETDDGPSVPEDL